MKTNGRSGPPIGASLSAAELAAELDISKVTVARKRRLGKSDDEIRHEAAHWRAELAAGRFGRHPTVHGNKQNSRPPGRTNGNSPVPPYAESQAKKELMLANLRELEYLERRRDLVPARALQVWLMDCVSELRSRALRLCGYAGDRFGRETAEWLEYEIRTVFRAVDDYAEGRAAELGLPPRPDAEPRPAPRP
jgi:hypothetical protein